MATRVYCSRQLVSLPDGPSTPDKGWSMVAIGEFFESYPEVQTNLSRRVLGGQPPLESLLVQYLEYRHRLSMALAERLHQQSGLRLNWDVEVAPDTLTFGSLTVLQKVGIAVSIVAGLTTMAASGPLAWQNTREIYVPRATEIASSILSSLNKISIEIAMAIPLVGEVSPLPYERDEHSQNLQLVLAEIRRRSREENGPELVE